jgi:ribosomal-protein-alanine N-acetyltransferase
VSPASGEPSEPGQPLEEEAADLFPLLGESVLVRPISEDDRRATLDLRRESEAFLRPWMPARPLGDPIYGERDFDVLLGSGWSPSRRCLVVYDRVGETLLGGVNLSEIVRGVFQNAFISYWVGAPHVGGGRMTEAVGLALAYAFGPVGLHRVEANIMPSNAPSLALAKKVGFRKEGYSPRYLKIAGRWEDHERWALTFEDWKQGKDPER